MYNQAKTTSTPFFLKNGVQYFGKAYRQVINSIAFLPTIIGTGFLIFAILMTGLEYSDWTKDVEEHLKPLLVRDPANGRTILGTVTASVISLMVFSFSMVMVVLNRATATLSPRVLPGLISRKFHQVVLGFYLGTIIFSLILLINTGDTQNGQYMPSLGILLSVIFCISCLSLFVYFIHSISRNIEVDSIMDNIYEETRAYLQKEGQGFPPKRPDAHHWCPIGSPVSGYLKHISCKQLTAFASANDLTLEMLVPVGDFIIAGFPIAHADKPLNEEQKNKLYSHLIFYSEERVSDHYLFGFKQISEIAIKALSPGINDPGTAVKAVNLLSDLFIRLSRISPDQHYTDQDGMTRLIVKGHDFQEIVFRSLMPILHYGKEDILVLKSLSKAAHWIQSQISERPDHSACLQKLQRTIKRTSRKNIGTKWERSYFSGKLPDIRIY